MPKPRTRTGEKNLISKHLIALRAKHGFSQRDLARQLQLAGYDMDKNVITRIRTIPIITPVIHFLLAFEKS